MLHRTLTPKAGAAAGRQSIARPARRRARNQLLIEKHLSNIYQRETFRQNSHVFLAPVFLAHVFVALVFVAPVLLAANGVICGFGPDGALTAVPALAALASDAG